MQIQKNTKFETLQNLSILLENFDNFYNKNVILAGDLNLFFNKKLECKGGSPILKKQSVSHIIKLQKAFDLCGIWCIRNPKKTFHFSDKSIFPELSDVDWTTYLLDILNAFSTNHSPVFCSFIKCLNYTKGSGFWEFKKLLICNSDLVDEMKS